MSFWDQFGLGGPQNSPDGGDQGMGGWSDSSGGGLSPSSITAGGGLAGLGLGALGTIESLNASEKEASYQSKAAGASAGIAALDMQTNNLKLQYASIMTRRLETQQVRKAQQLRAQGIAAGVNQGATGYGGRGGGGSGVAGGASGVSTGTAYNIGTLSSDFNMAQQQYNITNQQDMLKMAIAGYQSQAATSAGNASFWSGIASLGGDIMKAAPYAAALI